MARCPGCPLWVFGVYKKVGDSGDAVISEQGFSIVDTREQAIAMPLLSICLHNMYASSYKNQKFPEGRHREVCRFVLPGLHRITSVSGHCGMSRNERHTSTVVRLFHLSLARILCHPRTFRTKIYWDQYLEGGQEMVERRRWYQSTGVRYSEGHAFVSDLRPY